MTFLHWRYEPATIARLLPSGLEPDLVDGTAWVGLTLFCVERFRLPGMPPIPRISYFPETNLRTYVRHRAVGDALWFLSLDAASMLSVVGGRAGVGAPYFPARLRVAGGEPIVYEGRRYVGDAHYRIAVEPGPRLGEGEVSARDAALIGRWRAITRHVGGLLMCVPVQHEPWPIHDASVVELDESFVGAAGLPPPTDPPLVHYSPGVDVRLGAPRIVR